MLQPALVVVCVAIFCVSTWRSRSVADSYKRHGWLATLAEEAVARRCLSIEWESSRVNACIIWDVKPLPFQIPLTVYGGTRKTLGRWQFRILQLSMMATPGLVQFYRFTLCALALVSLEVKGKRIRVSNNGSVFRCGQCLCCSVACRGLLT